MAIVGVGVDAIEIARATGLTKGTVTVLVQELQRLGLLVALVVLFVVNVGVDVLVLLTRREHQHGAVARHGVIDDHCLLAALQRLASLNVRVAVQFLNEVSAIQISEMNDCVFPVVFQLQNSGRRDSLRPFVYSILDLNKFRLKVDQVKDLPWSPPGMLERRTKKVIEHRHENHVCLIRRRNLPEPRTQALRHHLVRIE